MSLVQSSGTVSVGRVAPGPATHLNPALSSEIGLYASSLTLDQHDGAAVLQIIQDHWSAIENCTHSRHDVTLGEDACRTEHRQGAAVLASLRNLSIGVYELERKRERTAADTLKSWCQQQTFSTLWPILQRLLAGHGQDPACSRRHVPSRLILGNTRAVAAMPGWLCP